MRGAGLASASVRRVDDAISAALAPSAVPMALFVAIIATGGSLYFSEVAGYAPCVLCWYQRIAMYPLVVILGVAAIRRDRSGVPAAIVLAAIGALIAAYHVALEWIPALDTGACDAAAPCTVVWFRALGVFSLPDARPRRLPAHHHPADGPDLRSGPRTESRMTTRRLVPVIAAIAIVAAAVLAIVLSSNATPEPGGSSSAPPTGSAAPTASGRARAERRDRHRGRSAPGVHEPDRRSGHRPADPDRVRHRPRRCSR